VQTTPMAVSNPPVTSSLDAPQDQDNLLKRRRPDDTPETSLQQTTDHHHLRLRTLEGPQDRKYIKVVCGGRSVKLVFDRFIKLDGNK